ncbi:hypothetical protein HS7_12490 [Sulfolobales archaeon HS-7]|nr:hypothetical protein HS7_12490 [Sulfolobales archaeon HS-7]
MTIVCSIENIGNEAYHDLHNGRKAVFVTADDRIDGKLYQIVADLIKLKKQFLDIKKIIWKN